MDPFSDTNTNSSNSGHSSDGGEDEYYFNATKGRGARKQRRKEEAIYGVFGDEDVGDRVPQGGGLGFVSFVKSETMQQGGKDDATGGVERDSEDPGVQESHGLGFTGGHGEGESPKDVPTSFGKRVRKAAAARREREFGRGKASSVLGEKEDAAVTAAGSSIGTFEAHTKGIGAKLLSKMGWKQGRGLGKGGKGLSEPLEAKLRPKRQGMGFGNRREPSLAPVPDVPVETKDEKKDVVDVKTEAKAWRKKGMDKKLKESKQLYKTVEDVLASSEGAKSSIQTIIDMRGPQKRVINDIGLSGLKEEELAHEGPMPELQHNMRLLVDITEGEIKKVDARIRHAKDTRVLLEKEIRRLEEEKGEAENHMETFSLVASVGRKITDGIKNGAQLLELRTLLLEAKALLGGQYFHHEFNLLALAVVHAPLVSESRGWSPLADPSMYLSELGEWKALLTEVEYSKQMYADLDVNVEELFSSMDPFVMLLIDMVLPNLRRDIQTAWNAKDVDRLETCIRLWEKILPTTMLQYITQHLVLPKLRSACQQWDPLTDHTAPHTWLHPWLVRFELLPCRINTNACVLTGPYCCLMQPYLGSHMDELWPIIRFKFTSALTQWHPSDPSALEILKPWMKVFKQHDWDHLCSKSIEPKLIRVLDSELQINPADQDMEPFYWVMAWDKSIRPDRLSRILDKHFFVKWRGVLRHWLSRNPDYDEIARWYLTWKACMSDELLETDIVSKNIEAALHDMNTAISGGKLEPTWTPAPMSAEDEHVKTKLKASQRTHLTMKELVAQFAEESGVEFLPKLGRMHEGFQVYYFGLVMCIVDSSHETISAQLDATSHTWRVVSLDQLLDENDRRLRRQSHK